MPENIPFYKLLRQRIAEHAEADYARITASTHKKTKTAKATQCRKWLDKFKQQHGMSYSTWHYKKTHGLLNETTQPVETDPSPAQPEDVAPTIMEPLVPAIV